MIKIDFENGTYICPFCGHAQAYYSAHDCVNNGTHRGSSYNAIPEAYQESSFAIHTFKCSNSSCQKISVTAINRITGKQIDLVPQVTIRHYPEYIPEQIRQDYEEANMILEASPKAAATLLRRCLQGMIHDYWKIHEKNLNAEITALKDKVPSAQWKALDALRKVGNIGAHMEKDVNLIIDIELGEAKKFLKLIELLFEKWYIARHDEEALLSDIVGIADEKDAERKTV